MLPAYKVQFGSIALSALEDAIRECQLVVVDEIGYMELKSHRFRLLIEAALSSSKHVVATIMRSHFDFPDAIKRRADVTLFIVNLSDQRSERFTLFVDRPLLFYPKAKENV